MVNFQMTKNRSFALFDQYIFLYTIILFYLDLLRKSKNLNKFNYNDKVIINNPT